MARQFDIPCVIRVTVSEESDGPGTIASKPATAKYAEGWEGIFGRKPASESRDLKQSN
jgi:hypothetical protein